MSERGENQCTAALPHATESLMHLELLCSKKRASHCMVLTWYPATEGLSLQPYGLGVPEAEFGQTVPPPKKSCCVGLFRSTSTREGEEETIFKV